MELYATPIGVATAVFLFSFFWRIRKLGTPLETSCIRLQLSDLGVAIASDLAKLWRKQTPQARSPLVPPNCGGGKCLPYQPIKRSVNPQVELHSLKL